MTDSSKQSFDEIVTALFDGEASEFELQRLLKHLDSADESGVQSIRKNLLDAGKTSAAITASSSPALGFGENLSFANGIAAAIADEEIGQLKGEQSDPSSIVSFQDTTTAKLQNEKKATPFGFSFGKAAIAASVAFVFVMGAQVFYSNDNDATNAIAAADVEQTPVQAVVPEGYIAPKFQANTASATGTTIGYPGKIELDEEQLQARLDELMREVRVRQLQQLKLQVENSTAP